MQDDTTAAPTAIAIARNYAELVDAFRKRCHELGAAMEQLDEIAGLPARYVSKLLAPVSVKAFGPISLGPLLGSSWSRTRKPWQGSIIGSAEHPQFADRDVMEYRRIQVIQA
jgi:hypothetical protein